MASVIFKNAKVVFTSSTQDISDHVTSLTLTRRYDIHDDTRMGLNSHSRIAGLQDWSFELELLQDFASTAAVNIDKTLSDFAAAGTAFGIAVRPVNAARSSDNPEYSGNVILESYTPMRGAVGDLLKTTVPLLSAGDLTRTVTSS